MSSAWPPELKAWVSKCLAAATPSNKAQVNDELRKVLFQAHQNGTMLTTDWATFELNSLKQQKARTSVTAPAPIASTSSLPTSFGSTSTTNTAPVVKQTAAAKRKKAAAAAAAAFPSAYTFASTDEDDMRAKRAKRFDREMHLEKEKAGAGPVYMPADNGAMGVTGLAKKKWSKMGLGYGAAEDEVDPNVIDWDKHTIKGTNQKLEKKYLRLTSEPSPADIRPLPVLQQTLLMLKDKWRRKSKRGEECSYSYICDQLKSVRQDLTVQRIKNNFTVSVYEMHARIALECKDLGEYNQCQSMLRQLYEHGLAGHPEEFLAYRILYLLHTRNRSDLTLLLAQLNEREKAAPEVHHALQIQAALATSNYLRFFRLFLNSPNMGAYLIDHFVERERISALVTMSKAYMTLPLEFIVTTLAFGSLEHADEFLSDHNAAVYVVPPSTTAPSSGPWKVVAKPQVIPLEKRVWDCRKAHQACAEGLARYRKVDIKGQVL